MSTPPSLPPEPTAADRMAEAFSRRTDGAARATGSGPPPKKKMSGCLIAALVGGGLAVVSIPVLAILAAIALPAYQDYVARTQVLQGYMKGRALAVDVEMFREQHQSCPTSSDVPLPDNGTVPLGGPNSNRTVTLSLGTDDGGNCTISMQFDGIAAVGYMHRTLMLVSDASGRWTCAGGDLSPRFRPADCKSGYASP